MPPFLFRSAEVSGYGGDETFGRDVFFRKNVDRAGVLAMTDSAAVKKAPRLPLIVLGALECKVTDEDAVLGMRVLAWARLVKVYGILRWATFSA